MSRLAAVASWSATVLAMAYVFLEHPSSLEHDTAAYPGEAPITMHPEQPSRIVAIERESRRAAGWGLSGCGLRPSIGLS